MEKQILIKEYVECKNCDNTYQRLVLQEDDEKVTLLEGDNYHDDIYSMIEGYLKALEHNNISYELTKQKIKCSECED